MRLAIYKAVTGATIAGIAVAVTTSSIAAPPSTASKPGKISPVNRAKTDRGFPTTNASVTNPGDITGQGEGGEADNGAFMGPFAPHQLPTVQADTVIDRNQVLARGQSWLAQQVPYSQELFYVDGYRQDCSGFVSMAWGLSASYTTSTMHRITNQISKDELRPGDVLNKAGSHVVLFAGWANAERTKYIGYEEVGGTVRQAREAVIPYPYFNGGEGYVPLRYKRITEGMSFSGMAIASAGTKRVNAPKADGPVAAAAVATSADGGVSLYAVSRKGVHGATSLEGDVFAAPTGMSGQASADRPVAAASSTASLWTYEVSVADRGVSYQSRHATGAATAPVLIPGTVGAQRAALTVDDAQRTVTVIFVTATGDLAAVRRDRDGKWSAPVSVVERAGQVTDLSVAATEAGVVHVSYIRDGALWHMVGQREADDVAWASPFAAPRQWISEPTSVSTIAAGGSIVLAATTKAGDPVTGAIRPQADGKFVFDPIDVIAGSVRGASSVKLAADTAGVVHAVTVSRGVAFHQMRTPDGGSWTVAKEVSALK